MRFTEVIIMSEYAFKKHLNKLSLEETKQLLLQIHEYLNNTISIADSIIKGEK